LQRSDFRGALRGVQVVGAMESAATDFSCQRARVLGLFQAREVPGDRAPPDRSQRGDHTPPCHREAPSGRLRRWSGPGGRTRAAGRGPRCPGSRRACSCPAS